MLKLLVIEDHALVREGLLQTLRGPDTVVVGAQNADEALAILDASADMDLVLLDLMLPGMNGMGLLVVMRKRFPAVPVVVISALDDAETVRRAIKAGASGFVPKASNSVSLLEALNRVLAGEIYLPQSCQDVAPTGTRGMMERRGLTVSQNRVLELLSQGRTNRQIGDLLGLTEGTVKIHVSAIFKVLNVNNRTQAMLVASKGRVRI
ncbi:MAG: response regulator transcription factor [Proteobacteria bacterium]|nr:response regulator transcription factor [Pseudomonadota bacterium]HQR05065.1 response regulator transcription factor [Rhodocyclaceae bacterium]